jgi:hypothetical protein
MPCQAKAKTKLKLGQTKNEGSEDMVDTKVDLFFISPKSENIIQ